MSRPAGRSAAWYCLDSIVQKGVHFSISEGRSVLRYIEQAVKYKVQVSVDKQFLISNEFLVIKDPNTDVSQNNLIELEKFQLDLLEQIKRATKIRNEIKIHKSKKGLSKAKREKFNKILDELETKDGNYMQPMLIDQLKYLYSMVNKADQVLGEHANNRNKELSIQLESITKKL